MDNTLFKPKNAPIRQPTSNKRSNGSIVNPPRLSEIGGLTLGSLSRNNMTLRKPGGTRSAD